ncbi:Transmembrane domain-containing protein [Spironucleus salmonicida]|uniref:Transmembrane domain-containing protein n=1 Tax=Spironucleus salmonicida TaxID=348837 RepID=A0A9P8S072_9EUKA|nr:Transmembrane domain-containing protein [Spironucleus salmonicida]
MNSKMLYLDGAEGLLLVCFVYQILHKFFKTDIIQSYDIAQDFTLWSKYVEAFYGIAGIRAYQWSKLNAIRYIKIFCTKIIHYQITHGIFCLFLFFIPYSDYRLTWKNILMLQGYFKARNDIFDITAVFTQIFQGYTIIVCLSTRFFSKNGILYQYAVIFFLFLLRIFYISRIIYTNKSYHSPQAFVGQGYQELMAFVILFRLSHHFEHHQRDRKFLESRSPLAVDAFVLAGAVLTSLALGRVSAIYLDSTIYQHNVLLALAYILLRPFFIAMVGVLIILLDYSRLIKRFLALPVLSKLVYRTRMFTVTCTGVFYQLLLYQLRQTKIGPYDPVLSGIVVVGALVLIQVFSAVLFTLFNPIILLLFSVFDDFCEQINGYIVLLRTNFLAKFVPHAFENGDLQ